MLVPTVARIGRTVIFSLCIATIVLSAEPAPSSFTSSSFASSSFTSSSGSSASSSNPFDQMWMQIPGQPTPSELQNQRFATRWWHYTRTPPQGRADPRYLDNRLVQACRIVSDRYHSRGLRTQHFLLTSSAAWANMVVTCLDVTWQGLEGAARRHHNLAYARANVIDWNHGANVRHMPPFRITAANRALSYGGRADTFWTNAFARREIFYDSPQPQTPERLGQDEYRAVFRRYHDAITDLGTFFVEGLVYETEHPRHRRLDWRREDDR